MITREKRPLLKSDEPTNEINYGSHYSDDTPVQVVWTLEEAIDNVGVGIYQIFIFGERFYFRLFQSCGKQSLLLTS